MAAAFDCAICEYTLREPDLEAATVGAIEDTISWCSFTKCGHVFHTLCLETWQLNDDDNSHKCPTCGRVIESGMISYAPNFNVFNPDQEIEMPPTPTYKLTYFNVRALAEPIRFAFAYAGVPYEDVRLERDTWDQQKSNYPWGTLPVLEVDGQVLAQSLAILRYLGKQFNLAGENGFEAAKCDEMVEALADLGKTCRDTFMEKDEEKKKELTTKLLTEIFPKYFGKWNDILEKNGGVLVGKDITYADLAIGSFLQLYNENLGATAGGNLYANYPAIQAHQEKVFNAPGIKEWVERRPKTPW